MEMLGKKRNNTKPKYESSFYTQLYTILNDTEYSECIKWSEDGSSIIILNKNALTEKVFPNFFKHHNYSSFVRQLNLYNFKKIKSSKKTQHIYKHDQFNSSKSIEEIGLIKRKDKIDDEFIIPSKTKHLFNEKLGENNLNEDKKEYIEKIEKLDEETKIKNFLNILKNGKLSNISNEIILNYLLDKSKESIEKEKKVETEINELIAQNNNLLDQVKKMKGMILYLMKKMYTIKNKAIKDKKISKLIKKYSENENKSKSSFKNLNIEKKIEYKINPDLFNINLDIINWTDLVHMNSYLYNKNIQNHNYFRNTISLQNSNSNNCDINSPRNTMIFNSKNNLLNYLNFNQI